MINKILIFGAGYVGSSLGILLSQFHEVVLIDNNSSKVEDINKKKIPITDPLINEFLKKNLNISASHSFKEHLNSTDLIILSVPTHFDKDSNGFDTSILEEIIASIALESCKASILIKSTVPIGFTTKLKIKYPGLKIIFSPEFLREGNAIQDNIFPSRIIFGASKRTAKVIADLFCQIAENSPKIFYMSSDEAEAVKLFANTYLANRVSFFNELDSFAFENKLNTKNIIDGVASDPRIGEGYHNPSFGYGGYCLPKDSKQLLANFKNIPQDIFKAIVQSNLSRKTFIANKILETNAINLGVYRLIMKKNSNNFREAAILDVIDILRKQGKNILIYEPLLGNDFNGVRVTKDLQLFKNSCDLIIANRMDKKLMSVKHKVFTRDCYGKD